MSSCKRSQAGSKLTSIAAGGSRKSKWFTFLAISVAKKPSLHS